MRRSYAGSATCKLRYLAREVTGNFQFVPEVVGKFSQRFSEVLWGCPKNIETFLANNGTYWHQDVLGNTVRVVQSWYS
jgi:hypothetical protein